MEVHWSGFWLLASVGLFGGQVTLRDSSSVQSEVCDTFDGFALSFEGLMIVFCLRQIACPLQQIDSRCCLFALTAVLLGFGLYTSALLAAMAIPISDFWAQASCYPSTFTGVLFGYCLISIIHIAYVVGVVCRNYADNGGFERLEEEEEVRPAALSEVQLSSIRVDRVSASDELCPICLEPCQGTIKTIQCGHRFHAACIDTWLKLKNSCALCRLPAAP